MKIYLNKNVYDAALDRIRWVFDNFPNVIAGVSGGKDSTVILHLALQVAREKGRLPLSIMFIDQEAEWDATIDIMREWMNNPDVTPLWYQIPIKMFNASSMFDSWLWGWDRENKDGWLREKEPISIKENTYGTVMFKELFKAIIAKEYPATPTAYLSGVRAEENPSRYMGVTEGLVYGDVTWGSTLDKKKNHYTFYPIYDWSYTDVWKAIFDNKWSYNKLYEKQFMYGIPLNQMRVSNLHHVTAVKSLFFLQEFEPDLYNRMTSRLSGIDMAGKMNKDDFFINNLPSMFTSWQEYRDYLLEKLIVRQTHKEMFRKWFTRLDRTYQPEVGEKLYRIQINSILSNDHTGLKMHNWECGPDVGLIRQRKQNAGLIPSRRAKKLGIKTKA